MNEMSNMAGILIGQIQDSLNSGGIGVKELPRLTNPSLIDGGQVNLYPSDKKGACCELAYIVALKSSPFGKGSGHISSRKGIEQLIQHVQACKGITQTVIFITAGWDSNAYNEWKGVLAEIDREINLEVYLLSGGAASIIAV